jgi:hypothetical protein
MTMPTVDGFTFDVKPAQVNEYRGHKIYGEGYKGYDKDTGESGWWMNFVEIAKLAIDSKHALDEMGVKVETVETSAGSTNTDPEYSDDSIMLG